MTGARAGKPQDRPVICAELQQISRSPFGNETWFGHGLTINMSIAFRERFGYTYLLFPDGQKSLKLKKEAYMDISAFGSEYAQSEDMIRREEENSRRYIREFLEAEKYRIIDHLYRFDYEIVVFCERPDGIRVVISEEILPGESYGSKTPAAVLTEIRKIMDTAGKDEDTAADGVLGILNDPETDLDRKLEKLGDLLDELSADDQDTETMKRIARVLRKRKVTGLLLGKFDPARPDEVTIYVRAIAEYAAGVCEQMRAKQPFAAPPFEFCYAAFLSQVLAHELFHLFHHLQSGHDPDLWAPKNTRGRKLLEALADFYAVMWCMDEGGAHEWAASVRYQDWVKYRYTAWPYAAALKFFKKAPGRYAPLQDYQTCTDGFRTVWNARQRGWKNAYREMEQL